MFLSDTKVGLSPDDQLILHAAREAPALFDRPSTVWKQPFTTASQQSITVPLLFNFYHSCSDPPIIPEPKPKPKPTIQQPAPGGHALSLSLFCQHKVSTVNCEPAIAASKRGGASHGCHWHPRRLGIPPFPPVHLLLFHRLADTSGCG